MWFTCATYTDSSFLMTDEIPRFDSINSKENIQSGYKNGSLIVN